MSELQDGVNELRAVHRGGAETADHAGLLLRVAELSAIRLRGHSTAGVSGAPDWFRYETLLWEIGEDLRQYLIKHRRIRGEHPVLRAAATISEDPAYGKGRESFVMLLGTYGGPEYADLLVRLLEDDEVCAHAIYALRRLGDGRFVERVRRVVDEPPTPAARTEAKAYLKKFGAV